MSGFPSSARSVAAAAAFLSLLATSTPAIAFKPDGTGHVVISEAQLKAYSRHAGNRTFHFSDKAVREIIDGNKYTDAVTGYFLYPPYHFDNEGLTVSSQLLIDQKETVRKKAVAGKGDDARLFLGVALHTMQDFYAHSSWVDLGNHALNPALGRSVLPAPGPATICPSKDKATVVTTGFFNMPDVWYAPPGHCIHGVDHLWAGINKDTSSSPYYIEAIAIAKLATVDYLDQFFEKIGADAKAVEALMGGGGTVGFVLDTSITTGLPAIKAGIAEALVRVPASQDPPAAYLLTGFGDTSGGEPVETVDPTELATDVAGFQPEPGQDEQSYAVTALVRSLDAARQGSRLFLLSDGPARDEALAGHAAFLAAARQVALDYVAIGAEDPSDALADVSEGSGGHSYRLEESDLAILGNVFAQGFSSNLGLVVSRSAKVSGENDTMAVPIDATVERALFVVSFPTGGSVEVLRPSGSPVVKTDADATVSSWRLGRLLEVRSPAAGVWKLRVSGTGRYEVDVLAESRLQLARVRLAEEGGGLAHEGIYPGTGLPGSDAPQPLLAALDGPYATVAFQLEGEGGDVLAPLDFSSEDPRLSASELLGEIESPGKAYRVAAVGTDLSGNGFRRLYPTLFQPQPVTVTRADAEPSPCLPAGTSTLEFEVRNDGPAARFDLVASDANGLVEDVQPRSVKLARGASRTVEVTVHVPGPLAAEGAPISLAVSATRRNRTEVHNGVLVPLRACSFQTAQALALE